MRACGKARGASRPSVETLAVQRSHGVHASQLPTLSCKHRRRQKPSLRTPEGPVRVSASTAGGIQPSGPDLTARVRRLGPTSCPPPMQPRFAPPGDPTWPAPPSRRPKPGRFPCRAARSRCQRPRGRGCGPSGPRCRCFTGSVGRKRAARVVQRPGWERTHVMAGPPSDRRSPERRRHGARTGGDSQLMTGEGQ